MQQCKKKQKNVYKYKLRTERKYVGTIEREKSNVGKLSLKSTKQDNTGYTEK